MTLNLPFVLILLAIIAAGVALGYVVLRAVMGPQAAQKNLAYSLPWILMGGLAGLLVPFLGGYGLTVLLGVYLAVVTVWLISWPWRRKGAGELRLNVGRTAQSKALLWVTLLTTVGAIALTLVLIDKITGPLATPAGILSGIVQILFLFAVPLFFFLLSRSHLEIREHGLAHLFAWQPWDRVTAFGWDDDKPTTLLFKVIPRSFISRRYLTLTVPAAQVEAVDKILEGYLIEDEDLDDEMDRELGRSEDRTDEPMTENG